MTADLMLSQALEVFLIARQADGYSPSTLEQYRWALGRLVKHRDKPLSKITTEDLRSFLAFMQTDYVPTRPGGKVAPLGSASIFHVWKAIRAFYKWACAEFEIPNPSLKIPMPRHASEAIVTLTKEEVKKLISACKYAAPANTTGRKTFAFKRDTGNRDIAIVITLVDTGLRVSELCRLTVEDVNLQVGELVVRPFRASLKSRPRVMPLGKAARKALALYMAERGPDRGRLFLARSGGEMDRGAVLHMLVALGERAGVPDVHPHRFRHTFATEYLRNGGDIFSLQKLLGHATLEMVRKYLDLVQSDVTNAHQRASPGDNWHL